MKNLTKLILGTIWAAFILNANCVQAQTVPIDRVPTVEALKDVEPNDWAYEALRSLIEKYNLISGYSDNTFRGDSELTRYEFAALLNEVSQPLTKAIASEKIASEDFTTLNRIIQRFSNELKALQSQVGNLETRIDSLENTQFSTTTKLKGQVIFAANAGGFSGERIIAPRGALISEEDPSATFIHRTALFFNTSFNGQDQLQVRFITGSDGTDDNAGGLLEPNFGSNLDYTIQGRNNQISVARAFYQFSPHQNLNFTVGPVLVITDYVDQNNLVGASFQDFSTLAFANNFVLFPTPAGGGAIVEWNPKGGAFHLRAAYAAGDSGNTLPGNERLFGGGGEDDVRLFPAGGGGAEGGLFDDPRQGVLELGYSPTDSLGIRLLYSGGEIFGSSFDGVGINFDWSFLPNLGIFGRYGYSEYDDTTIGDINPNYWLAGLTVFDLFVEASISGIAVGQPFVESAAGDATQTNFEVFYNYPINDSIRITPLAQIILDPSNQSSNGAIYSVTLRGVFSF